MRKNIVLIGGSYGIGFEIALKLYHSHTLFIASRTSENLGNLEVTHIPYDASKDEIDISLLPERIDGFVYCPGSINLKPFDQLTSDIFAQDMKINFMFLVKIVHTLLPRLKKSDQASLIFFSTVAVQIGIPNHTSIAAAKGAIEGFAKALAAEYAPKIRVNIIAPSLITISNFQKESKNKRHSGKQIEKIEDIANIAKFLLSDDSSWITGQIIGVDGGIPASK